MSRLLIIRHGQASLGAADYDVLSPIGGLQAEALGQHLGRMIDPPHAIYAGPRKRQRDTASILVAAARATAAFPDPQELPEFDEYPSIALVKDARAELCAEHPELAALTATWMSTTPGTPEHQRAFELMFQATMHGWHAGTLVHPTVEPFADFQARVCRGLDMVMERHPRRSTVIIVSSAGPVGVIVARALGLDTWHGLKTSFIVHNASITELAYRPGELQLRAFNALPHLRERAHVTLR